MSQKKTEFRFRVGADPAAAETIIRGYLMINGFESVPTPGANYYCLKMGLMNDNRSFEYYINDGEVTILAYLGSYKRPKPLRRVTGSTAKLAYKEDLNALFEELKKLENREAFPLQGRDETAGTEQVKNSLQNFVDRNEKKRGDLAVFGLLVCIIGFILPFFGYSFGLLMLLVEFYCGIVGLKSSKKGCAVATVVLAGISSVILIVRVVAQLMLNAVA